MFTQASPFGRSTRMAGMYSQVGIATGVASASPHMLTLMLFDGFLKAVKLARQAVQTGDVHEKGQQILRAARIIDEGLKASLNLKDGGELALNLRDLYDYVQVRLMQANLRNDEEALAEVLRLMEPVREGWVGIGASVPA